jgi:hypothetical protein
MPNLTGAGGATAGRDTRGRQLRKFRLRRVRRIRGRIPSRLGAMPSRTMLRTALRQTMVDRTAPQRWCTSDVGGAAGGHPALRAQQARRPVAKSLAPRARRRPAGPRRVMDGRAHRWAIGSRAAIGPADICTAEGGGIAHRAPRRRRPVNAKPAVVYPPKMVGKCGTGGRGARNPTTPAPAPNGRRNGGRTTESGALGISAHIARERQAAPIGSVGEAATHRRRYRNSGSSRSNR